MSQKNLALSKTNLIICGIAVLLIVVGLLLMTGPSTTVSGFEPDIFSIRRIRVAPVVALSGFVLMIVGILYPSNKEKKGEK
jgi:hypothetical protein